LDHDYNALIDEKSNIYNEWPELSKKSRGTVVSRRQVTRRDCSASYTRNVALIDPSIIRSQ